MAVASHKAIRASPARWHRRLPCPSPSASGSQPLLHRGGDRVDTPCSIDHDAALGLALGDLEESCAYPLVETTRQAFVTGFAAAPFRRALQPGLDRQVEDDREIGPEGADGNVIELVED